MKVEEETLGVRGWVAFTVLILILISSESLVEYIATMMGA